MYLSFLTHKGDAHMINLAQGTLLRYLIQHPASCKHVSAPSVSLWKTWYLQSHPRRTGPEKLLLSLILRRLASTSQFEDVALRYLTAGVHTENVS